MVTQVSYKAHTCTILQSTIMSNDVSSKDDNRNNDNAISCSRKLTKRKNSIKNKYWTNKDEEEGEKVEEIKTK